MIMKKFASIPCGFLSFFSLSFPPRTSLLAVIMVAFFHVDESHEAAGERRLKRWKNSGSNQNQNQLNIDNPIVSPVIRLRCFVRSFFSIETRWTWYRNWNLIFLYLQFFSFFLFPPGQPFSERVVSEFWECCCCCICHEVVLCVSFAFASPPRFRGGKNPLFGCAKAKHQKSEKGKGTNYSCFSCCSREPCHAMWKLRKVHAKLNCRGKEIVETKEPEKKTLQTINQP